MPWWGWVLIGIAAAAIIVPIKVKVAKKIFRKKKPEEEEAKEDF